MPIIIPGTAAAGGPAVSTSIWFGGLPMPNGQGTMAWLNLNDSSTWKIQDLNLDANFRQIGAAQFIYRQKGVYTADDKGPRQITLSAFYDTSITPLGQSIAKLSEAGEQYLSFDNQQTAILAKFLSVTNRKLHQINDLTGWVFDLGFFCRNSWFQDIATTTIAAFAVSGTTGGSTTNQNVTYPGQIGTEPIWTFTVGAANPASISSLVLKNSMAVEPLTITFPGNWPASTALTLTIDTGAWTVTDQNGKSYDISGSFPGLYGPVNQVQQMSVTVTTASGTLSNATMSGTYVSRWEI